MPRTEVVVRYEANVTDLRFRGLRVFLESSGDPDRDRRNLERFKHLVDDLIQEREDRVLGRTYGRDLHR